jgi:hypothetical protein
MQRLNKVSLDLDCCIVVTHAVDIATRRHGWTIVESTGAGVLWTSRVGDHLAIHWALRRYPEGSAPLDALSVPTASRPESTKRTQYGRWKRSEDGRKVSIDVAGSCDSLHVEVDLRPQSAAHYATELFRVASLGWMRDEDLGALVRLIQADHCESDS